MSGGTHLGGILAVLDEEILRGRVRDADANGLRGELENAQSLCRTYKQSAEWYEKSAKEYVDASTYYARKAVHSEETAEALRAHIAELTDVARRCRPLIVDSGHPACADLDRLLGIPR